MSVQDSSLFKIIASSTINLYLTIGLYHHKVVEYVPNADALALRFFLEQLIQ